eukprot:CAMPEP_0194308332 /NCGR_PEP_ID=MMETSP0171-20130528/5301_1 /TAXON_ID=218684 /ORGANISM="Corethron pennatum, Strain L29A3" /LENGTH=94 /DNA_ID=CAMNT_0039060919 /DNA_START=290 /DNA_END=574 /DNA_ORIENTATION=-
MWARSPFRGNIPSEVAALRPRFTVDAVTFVSVSAASSNRFGEEIEVGVVRDHQSVVRIYHGGQIQEERQGQVAFVDAAVGHFSGVRGGGTDTLR